MARLRVAPRPQLQAGGIPAALALGRCIEVWGSHDDSENGSSIHMSAFSRWDRVRRWWLETNGITDTAEQCRLVPFGSPWSIDYLNVEGRGDWFLEKFRAIGATPADVPALREQAMELHEQAVTVSTTALGPYWTA